MSRVEQRKRLKAQGLQDTQRSWDNYVGDRPIKARERDGYYDNARAVLASGGTLPPSSRSFYQEPPDDPAFEEEEKKKRAFSRLRSAMENL